MDHLYDSAHPNQGPTPLKSNRHQALPHTSNSHAYTAHTEDQTTSIQSEDDQSNPTDCRDQRKLQLDKTQGPQKAVYPIHAKKNDPLSESRHIERRQEHSDYRQHHYEHHQYAGINDRTNARYPYKNNPDNYLESSRHYTNHPRYDRQSHYPPRHPMHYDNYDEFSSSFEDQHDGPHEYHYHNPPYPQYPYQDYTNYPYRRHQYHRNMPHGTANDNTGQINGPHQDNHQPGYPRPRARHENDTPSYLAIDHTPSSHSYSKYDEPSNNTYQMFNAYRNQKEPNFYNPVHDMRHQGPQQIPHTRVYNNPRVVAHHVQRPIKTNHQPGTRFPPPLDYPAFTRCKLYPGSVLRSSVAVLPPEPSCGVSFQDYHYHVIAFLGRGAFADALLVSRRLPDGSFDSRMKNNFGGKLWSRLFGENAGPMPSDWLNIEDSLLACKVIKLRTTDTRGNRNQESAKVGLEWMKGNNGSNNHQDVQPPASLNTVCMEYQTHLRLNHCPNVLTTYALLRDVSAPYAYLLSEYAPGGSLETWLRQQSWNPKYGSQILPPIVYPESPNSPRCLPLRRLPIRTLIDVILQMTHVGIELARNGIIHRDIKPTNILLDIDEKKILLADFGLAKVLCDFPLESLGDPTSDDDSWAKKKRTNDGGKSIEIFSKRLRRHMAIGMKRLGTCNSTAGVAEKSTRRRLLTDKSKIDNPNGVNHQTAEGLLRLFTCCSSPLKQTREPRNDGKEHRSVVEREKTKTGSLVGTPNYVAPEIIRGRVYGGSCDLWSFGVLIFTLLCGFAPFEGPDRIEWYLDVLERYHLVYAPDGVPKNIDGKCHDIPLPPIPKSVARLAFVAILSQRIKFPSDIESRRQRGKYLLDISKNTSLKDNDRDSITSTDIKELYGIPPGHRIPANIEFECVQVSMITDIILRLLRRRPNKRITWYALKDHDLFNHTMEMVLPPSTIAIPPRHIPYPNPIISEGMVHHEFSPNRRRASRSKHQKLRQRPPGDVIDPNDLVNLRGDRGGMYDDGYHHHQMSCKGHYGPNIPPEHHMQNRYWNDQNCDYMVPYHDDHKCIPPNMPDDQPVDGWCYSYSGSQNPVMDHQIVTPTNYSCAPADYFRYNKDGFHHHYASSSASTPRENRNYYHCEPPPYPMSDRHRRE